MRTDQQVQNWYTGLDPRLAGVLVGAAAGLLAGIVALMLALLGPVLTLGAVGGLLAGLYVLTSIQAALYGVVVVMMLLPFGTLPFSIGFTPSLLDVMLGAFFLVYVAQWMTGKRQDIRLTPVHGLLALYIVWLLVAFALGLRYGMPTPNLLKQFVETLLALLLPFILVDLVRDPATLRRLVLVVVLAVGAQAVIALGLWVLPERTAESLLRLLTRIGYPDNSIIRYIESNPALPERAIGTWVDPNTLGGALAIAAAMIAPQVFARRPVLPYRLLTLGVLGAVGVALLLTFSRTSMLAFGAGLAVIAVVRYRGFIPLMAGALLLILLLPQTRGYVERFIDAFTGGDLATQMRIGEYSDALTLISRYPLTGVGFTGTPDITVYTDVASMYLIMANQIGLVGVGLYLLVVGGVLVYGWRAWRYAHDDDALDSIHLGYHAALITALVNGIGDLYYFRVDFQASITLFWLTVALALTASRQALAAQGRPNEPPLRVSGLAQEPGRGGTTGGI